MSSAQPDRRNRRSYGRMRRGCAGSPSSATGSNVASSRSASATCRISSASSFRERGGPFTRWPATPRGVPKSRSFGLETTSGTKGSSATPDARRVGPRPLRPWLGVRGPTGRFTSSLALFGSYAARRNAIRGRSRCRPHDRGCRVGRAAEAAGLRGCCVDRASPGQEPAQSEGHPPRAFRETAVRPRVEHVHALQGVLEVAPPEGREERVQVLLQEGRPHAS